MTAASTDPVLARGTPGYHAAGSTTPPLRPEAYRDPAFAEAERPMLTAAWYPVATSQQLANTGDFVSGTFAGVPVAVRNFGKEGVIAVRNVCAHRACTMVQEPAGNADRLRCPYHGWEYGPDGLTRKIPGAKNFPHFDRDAHRLDLYPVQRMGDLWFVRPSVDGPTLREFVGEPFEHFAANLSAPAWRPTWTHTLDYAANWKVPIEGSLESYHIPAVHAETFGHDPGEDRSVHEMRPGHTAFFTSFKVDGFMTRLEDWALRRLGAETPGVYEHWHVFPNLMFSLTDSVSLIQSLTPTGPTTSRALLFQYTRQPARRGLIANNTARSLGRIAGSASLRILNEDRPMFEAVQRGLDGTPAGHPRRTVFGRCEERLQAFGEWVAGRT